MESKYYEMIVRFLENSIAENDNASEIQQIQNKIKMMHVIIRHFRFIENSSSPTSETKAEYNRRSAVAEDILAA